MQVWNPIGFSRGSSKLYLCTSNRKMRPGPKGHLADCCSRGLKGPCSPPNCCRPKAPAPPSCFSAEAPAPSQVTAACVELHDVQDDIAWGGWCVGGMGILGGWRAMGE